MNIRREVDKRANYLVRLRKHFHMHPELSMKEFETSKRIREELENMEIPYLVAGKTGVIGLIGHGLSPFERIWMPFRLQNRRKSAINRSTKASCMLVDMMPIWRHC